MEFKKLSEVTSVETVADSANVLVEQNGEIVRAPKGAVGSADSAGPVFAMLTYDGSNFAANMTYEEAFAAFEAGTLVGGIFSSMTKNDGVYTYMVSRIWHRTQSSSNKRMVFEIDIDGETNQFEIKNDGSVGIPMPE